MNITKLRMISVCLCLAALPVAAGAQTLATINGKAITMAEFKKKYELVRTQPFSPSIPTPDEFLEDLIRLEVGVQEAEKKGLQNDPIVKDRVREAMYKALVEKSLGDKVNAIKVSEAEMKRYYDKNPEIESSHILIEFKQNASPKEKSESLNRANELTAEVKKSKRDFADLVKLYSDDVVSKNVGGNLGYQSRLTLGPNYYDAVVKMKVGEIRGPIETRYGYHIIKVTGRRTYNEITDKRPVRTLVYEEKKVALFNELFKGLKAKYKIKVNRSALKGFKVE